MNSITSLIPRPRPVTIAAIDRTFQVSEFTLNDLADLQAILDGQWTDPLVAIEPELQAAQGDERRLLLVDAYDVAEAGPPVYGEPSGRPYYASLEGIAAMLWVALRKHHADVTPEYAAGLVMQVSESEYSQIWRITHGAKTLKSLERMLGLGTAKSAAPEMTWGELVDEVVQSHPGWTYQDVYGLTVTEFMNARRMGKPETAGVSIPMDAVAMEKAMREQRERYYGPNGEIEGGK